jgi:hypothetical protein
MNVTETTKEFDWVDKRLFGIQEKISRQFDDFRKLNKLSKLSKLSISFLKAFA